MKLRFARNAILNFAGGAIPALATLATIPFIVRGLGDAGYGLFTLITAIVGYFALLDINVTAGSVKYLAEYSAQGDHSKRDQTVSFGLITYLCIGFAGAVAIFLSTDALIERIFSVPAELRAIARTSLQVAALGFLFGQLQTYLQSVPQALLRYDITSKFEVAFGLALPLISVFILMAGYGLVELIVFRVIASGVNCLFLWRSIGHLMPDLSLIAPGRQIMGKLAEFSAYSFLNRVAAVTYVHADKLVIGALLGVKELAYYTVAATIGQRVLGLTFRVSAVMFPIASVLDARGEHSRLEELYIKISRYVVYINGAALILIAVFAEPILHYWIGKEFALQGAAVLQLIAIAQFVDSLTNVPSLVNDGMGHPRVSGLFAVTRAFFGLAVVYWFVGAQGIIGAGWAHLAVALIMTVGFFAYVHERTVPCNIWLVLSRGYRRPFFSLVAVAVAAVTFQTTLGAGFINLLAGSIMSSILLSVAGYFWILFPDDRKRIGDQFRRFTERR